MDDKLLITRETTPEGLLLHLEGRIDGYWSKQLDEYLDEALRAGHDHIGLNLEKVEYLSSLGIRILVKYVKQLKQVNGSFGLVKVSDNVQSVLDMVGLAKILRWEQPLKTAPHKVEVSSTEKDGISYQCQRYSNRAPMKCRIQGNPEKIFLRELNQKDCRTVPFGPKKYGIGLGAIGTSYEDCKTRFGDFVGFGDAVVFMPSGRAKSPDYMIKTGALIPEINMLYGILFEGEFDGLVNFSAVTSGESVPMSRLLSHLFELTGEDALVMVMLAETSGMVGVSLSESPVADHTTEELFRFPEVREQVNFTTEPEFRNMMTITVGMAARKEMPQLKDFTRPACEGSPITQHFHSAIFTYHPLRKSDIHLDETITTFFEQDKIQSVLHLINDQREAVGAGESEFTHGTCWVSRINSIELNKEV